jgi:hypothetical protein
VRGGPNRRPPLDAATIPSVLPDFRDARLDEAALSPSLVPLTTSWLPLQPTQPEAPGAPLCPRFRDIPTASGLARWDEWMAHTLADLQSIERQLASGVPPSEVSRDRPAAIAIGQDETNSWARGRVWDCTYEASSCCVVMDFAHRGKPNLNTDWIRTRLKHYPDQGLVAHLVDGARLDADVELQTVLVPHLASLPLGFESVASELRRLWGEGWYTFHPEGMYWPAYYNGQGAAARRLEDRYRRTTEGGGCVPTPSRLGAQGDLHQRRFPRSPHSSLLPPRSKASLPRLARRAWSRPRRPIRTTVLSRCGGEPYPD